MGRGLVSLDYDNDGDLDVFLVNHGARPILYRNDGGNENDWLRINVQGSTSNRDGLGTLITLDPDTDMVGDEMVREINGGSNFLSHNELTAHFGLGANAANIDLITVAWPSGAVQKLTAVAPNQELNLVEGALALAGDYNHDLAVDAADYAVWRKQLGSIGSGMAADGNGDSIINQLDYVVWRTNFGATTTGTASEVVQLAALPAPSSLSLLVAGAAVATNATRRGSHRARIKR
jgi:hypothetical protein